MAYEVSLQDENLKNDADYVNSNGGDILKVVKYNQKFKNFKMNDVDFRVKRGTIHALIGESGSGKSVIIQSIVGSLPHFRGKIYVNGYRSSSWKAKLQIGFSTNFESFPNEVTAYEFLKYLGQLTSLKNKWLISRIESLLVEFGLWEHRNKKIKTFSSGMKNRIMLIHAMMNDPELLIFDEPGANLDFRNRQLFYHILDELRSQGKTIFLTTHMIDELDTLIDECTIISYGKLLYTGSYKIFLNQKNYCLKTNGNKLIIEYLASQNYIVHYNESIKEISFTIDGSRKIQEIYDFIADNRISIDYCYEIKNDLMQLKLKLFSLKQNHQV